MKHYIYIITMICTLAFISGCSNDTTGQVTDTENNLVPDDNSSVDYHFIFKNVSLHDDTFTTNHFSGSQNCISCHNGLSDTTNGKDVSIVDAWQSSMMANAAIDPLWRAKVASEVKRNPDYKM